MNESDLKIPTVNSPPKSSLKIDLEHDGSEKRSSVSLKNYVLLQK